MNSTDKDDDGPSSIPLSNLPLATQTYIAGGRPLPVRNAVAKLFRESVAARMHTVGELGSDER